jgi:hypothetical protein
MTRLPVDERHPDQQLRLAVFIFTSSIAHHKGHFAGDIGNGFALGHALRRAWRNYQLDGLRGAIFFIFLQQVSAFSDDQHNDQ